MGLPQVAIQPDHEGAARLQGRSYSCDSACPGPFGYPASTRSQPARFSPAPRAGSRPAPGRATGSAGPLRRRALPIGERLTTASACPRASRSLRARRPRARLRRSGAPGALGDSQRARLRPARERGEVVGARDGSGLARSGTGRPSCPRRRGPSSRSPSSLGGRSPPPRSPGGRSLRWRRPARRHGLPRSLRARRPRRRTGLLAGVTGRLQSARPAAPGAGSLPPPALPSAPQGGSLFSSRFRALVMFPVQQGAWGIPAGLLACRWPGPQQQAAYVEPQAQQRAKQLEQFLTVNHTVNSTRFTRRETRKRPSRGP